MSWQASSGFRQRSWPWLASLLLINFLLMTYDARDASTNRRLIHSWMQAVFSPVMSFVSGSGSFVQNSVQYFSDLRHASTENVELREKLRAQETELTQTRIAAAESERLKGLLKIKEEGQYKVVPARVIAHDPSGWFESITINRGRNDGVELSMPVVTVDGIVGRVIGTSPWTAQILIITDERFGAGVAIGRLDGSSAMGSIRGLGERG
ncbi:MAG: rod shape-determining protein MreC, partial [Pyrinomonadaceae bacterium]